MNQNQNSLAKIILIVGLVQILCGVICGIYFGGHEYNGDGGYVSVDFAFVEALMWWISSFIIGLFIIGFSEIIRLLQRISDSLDKKN